MRAIMKKRIVFKDIDISVCAEIEELINKDKEGVKTYTLTKEEQQSFEKDFNDGTLEALFEKEMKKDGFKFTSIKKEIENNKEKSNSINKNKKQSNKKKSR